MDTDECDEFYNMKDVRDETKDKINKGDPDRLRRIMLMEDQWKDRSVVDDVATRYRMWYSDRVWNALPFASKWRHQLFDTRDDACWTMLEATLAGWVAGAPLRRVPVCPVDIGFTAVWGMMIVAVPRWLRANITL